MPHPTQRTNPLLPLLLFLTGIILAITTSVFASSLGTNLSVTGNLVVNSTSATSTFAAPIAGATGNLTISSAGTTNNLLLNPYGGNVGVATPSPGQQLDISKSTNGNLYARVYNTSNGTGALGEGLFVPHLQKLRTPHTPSPH